MRSFKNSWPNPPIAVRYNLTESSNFYRLKAGLDDIKSMCEELKAKLEVKSKAVEQLEVELENEKELRQTTELEKEEFAVKIQELDGNIEDLKSKIQSSAEGQSEEVTQTLAQL